MTLVLSDNLKHPATSTQSHTHRKYVEPEVRIHTGRKPLQHRNFPKQKDSVTGHRFITFNEVMPFSSTIQHTLKGTTAVHKMTCLKDVEKHISLEYTNSRTLLLSVRAEYLWAFAVGLDCRLQTACAPVCTTGARLVADTHGKGTDSGSCNNGRKRPGFGWATTPAHTASWLVPLPFPRSLLRGCRLL